jgi:MoaA/NifB/PqqE/SkfB family radical SAM enzyme
MTSYDSFCCFRGSSDRRPRVLWELNTACNLACSFCHAKPNADPGIALADIRAGLRLLSGWGVGDVIFSGGEPLLRRDILEILDAARGLGLDVDLCTNGTLIDAELAGRLREVLSEVSVSVDSATPATHDALRRQRGSWAKTVRGIENLASAGVEVHVISLVTDTTASAIEETTRFVRSLGAESITLLGLMPYPEGTARRGGPPLPTVQPHEGTDHRLSLHTRLALEASLPQMRRRLDGFRINTKCILPSRRLGACGAGTTILGVDARGMLLPCILLKGMSGAKPLLHYAADDDPWGALQRFSWKGRERDMRQHPGGCIAVDAECWQDLRP